MGCGVTGSKEVYLYRRCVDGVLDGRMLLLSMVSMFVNRTDLVSLLFKVREDLRTREGKFVACPFF